MKIKELREKSNHELEKMLSDLREKTGKLRFELEAKKLKNNQGLKNTRRTIAQILTIFKEKELKS
jgi:large subunit ribosomal protein L29